LVQIINERLRGNDHLPRLLRGMKKVEPSLKPEGDPDVTDIEIFLNGCNSEDVTINYPFFPVDEFFFRQEMLDVPG